MIKDVTDLDVYNFSLELLKRVYALGNKLSPEYKSLKFQLLRASQAIAPQIAEGFARKHSPKEFARYLSIALGSSDEVITHIREVKMINEREEWNELLEDYKVLSKKLNRLLTVWRSYK